MNFKELEESSGSSPQGSITNDLILSKMWICEVLKHLNRKKFSTIYILGSWYGNMALILDRMGIEHKNIINVDKNKEWLEFGDRLLNRAGIKADSMLKDANTLDYRQLDKNGLIINTGINDIKGSGWWNNIPKNTLVVLQSRNQVEHVIHHSLEEFNKDFPLSKTLYVGETTLTDPETKYNRFMKIGIK
jgi:hypothetical protein